jgi:predicted phosphodiesterase
MLIALLTDIHGNREAFEACLHDARRMRADRFVFLGDYVGYGAATTTRRSSGRASA